MISDWVVVVDGDVHSTRQKEVCQTLKPALKGMIDCNDIDNTNTPACQKVLNFPAFCHIPSNSCVYGVRDTMDLIDHLPTLLKESTASNKGTTQENQSS
jgi:hypothetical protein